MGIVALPAGVISLLALISTLEFTMGFAPKRASEFLGELLGGLLIYAVILVVFFLFRYGLRQIAPSAAAVQREDQRAPILLLRSFKDGIRRLGDRTNGL
jgi:hypothetical protein